MTELTLTKDCEDAYTELYEFFGREVICTVPVEWWSDDWHDGMRSRQYVGTVCSHHNGGFCLQPPPRAQGLEPERACCFPLKPGMHLALVKEGGNVNGSG